MPIPLDDGARVGRRVGPFWIEEPPGPLWVGAAILVVVVGLYSVAAILNGA